MESGFWYACWLYRMAGDNEWYRNEDIVSVHPLKELLQRREKFDQEKEVRLLFFHRISEELYQELEGKI